MTKVVVNDLRVAGVGTCPVAKAWFAEHGIAWRDLRDGIDISRVSHINDPRMNRVIEAAKAREARDGR